MSIQKLYVNDIFVGKVNAEVKGHCSLVTEFVLKFFKWLRTYNMNI
jgi:hypothetical protein